MASSSADPGSCGTSHRSVLKKFKAHSQREGAGFVVRRPIGGFNLTDQEADPFLMLDELGPSHYEKGEFPGAPWHPHRGFDTVMYLLEGEGSHQDSMGNSGTLRAGDCQWMTAGSGLIHDEGKDHPGGVLHGFQCWVNLPRKHKMCPPRYQDVPNASIPVVEVAQGVVAKIIAGECAGHHAVIQTIVPIQYIHFTLEPGAEFVHEMPEHLDTCLVYVFSGSGHFGDELKTPGDDGELLSFSDAGSLPFRARKDGLQFLLLAGKKIKEPIVKHGPFVMNSREEIMQAILDFQAGPEVFCKHKGTFKSEF